MYDFVYYFFHGVEILSKVCNNVSRVIDTVNLATEPSGDRGKASPHNQLLVFQI